MVKKKIQNEIREKGTEETKKINSLIWFNVKEHCKRIYDDDDLVIIVLELFSNLMSSLRYMILSRLKRRIEDLHIYAR